MSSQSNMMSREKTPQEQAGLAAMRRASRKQVLRPVLMIGGPILVLLAAFLFWLNGGRYVYTDDSYVDAAKVSLSTDVSGLVSQVFVKDNQHVRAGQKLFDLSPRGFAIAVAQAQAQLGVAEQDVNAAKRAYAAAQAEIDAQKAQIEKDKANMARYAAVVKSGGVTRAQYDDARFTLQADEAKLLQLQAAAGQQLSKLNGNPKINPKDTPQYQNALAVLHTALLNQKHSVVRAPYAGTVTEVEQLQPGMYLPAGTAAFALVSDQDTYINAQPKENQLTWVRPGQSVHIHVDTYPNASWKGVVQSISPASGSTFSILPAQNSSGNWVKVVQRIPVRIAILSGPKNKPLRVGMSVEVNIDTNHHRHLSDLF